MNFSKVVSALSLIAFDICQFNVTNMHQLMIACNRFARDPATFLNRGQIASLPVRISPVTVSSVFCLPLSAAGVASSASCNRCKQTLYYRRKKRVSSLYFFLFCHLFGRGNPILCYFVIKKLYFSYFPKENIDKFPRFYVIALIARWSSAGIPSFRHRFVYGKL